MKITLPNNGLGVLLMLALVLLIIVVPFTLVLWLVSLIAPWWVALPLGLAASLLAFLTGVRFRT